MKFKELVDRNRSHREFKSEETISTELIRDWLSNANHCPAAMNLQTLKYRIVNEKKEVDALLSLTRWAAALKKKLPPEGHGPSAFVVICHDTNLAPLKSCFMIDVGIAAQTIMLSATEAGYGGCIIGSADFEKVTELFGLSDNLTPVLVLAIGIAEDNVILTVSDGNSTYYRDKENNHYVPKRALNDIIIS